MAGSNCAIIFCCLLELALIVNFYYYLLLLLLLLLMGGKRSIGCGERFNHCAIAILMVGTVLLNAREEEVLEGRGRN